MTINKQKIVAITALCVVVGVLLIAKNVAQGKFHLSDLSKDTVDVSKIIGVKFACDATFDGSQSRSIEVLFGSGKINYKPTPPDADYFYGGFSLTGATFHAKFIALFDPTANTQQSTGYYGAYQWNGTFTKATADSLKFDAMETFVGRNPAQQHIVATCQRV